MIAPMAAPRPPPNTPPMIAPVAPPTIAPPTGSCAAASCVGIARAITSKAEIPTARIIPITPFVGLFYGHAAKQRPGRGGPPARGGSTFQQALQYLLLGAMREVHSAPGPFNRLGEFPAEQPNDLPFSATAEAFYRSGPLFWQLHVVLGELAVNRIVFFWQSGCRGDDTRHRLCAIILPVAAPAPCQPVYQTLGAGAVANASGQLHNSFTAGSRMHGGRDDVLTPALLLVADPLLDPPPAEAPPPDVEPPPTDP
jgi:hypothetical protein